MISCTKDILIEQKYTYVSYHLFKRYSQLET